MHRTEKNLRSLGLSLVVFMCVGEPQRALAAEQTSPKALIDAMTFRASFDGGVEAERAMGDPKMYWAASMNKRQEAQPGLPPSGEVVLEKQPDGSDALFFTKRKAPVIFYKAERNVPFASNNWSGTVSFWLKVDPATDLEPGFCDPIQITPRAWNDAAFFVEFEKKKDEIPFRLGIYPNLKTWNPNNRDWNAIPVSEKPILSVAKPPFNSSQWTHVVFTFAGFNTGKPNGVASLYLDGKNMGSLPAREQTFSWDISHTSLMLGLSFVGRMDELTIFNRELTQNEVSHLHGLTVHPKLPK